jgi:hypothetical protein
MTNTDVRKWHDYYENNLQLNEKHCVDDSFKAIVSVFDEYGIDQAGDDRAEELIAAITKYLIESMQ